MASVWPASCFAFTNTRVFHLAASACSAAAPAAEQHGRGAASSQRPGQPLKIKQNDCFLTRYHERLDLDGRPLTGDARQAAGRPADEKNVIPVCRLHISIQLVFAVGIWRLMRPRC